jgi:hypothetical protein
MCGREAKFSLSLHCFSAGVYILFQSLNIVFIASLQSPFVLCDSRALPRTCFNSSTLYRVAASATLRPNSHFPTLNNGTKTWVICSIIEDGSQNWERDLTTVL